MAFLIIETAIGLLAAIERAKLSVSYFSASTSTSDVAHTGRIEIGADRYTIDHGHEWGVEGLDGERNLLETLCVTTPQPLWITGEHAGFSSIACMLPPAQKAFPAQSG